MKLIFALDAPLVGPAVDQAAVDSPCEHFVVDVQLGADSDLLADAVNVFAAVVKLSRLGHAQTCLVALANYEKVVN